MVFSFLRLHRVFLNKKNKTKIIATTEIYETQITKYKYKYKIKIQKYIEIQKNIK
jgi:hypothetical protein